MNRMSRRAANLQPLPRERSRERAWLRLELKPLQAVLPVLLRSESGRATTILVRGSTETELPPGLVTAELRLPSGELLVQETTLSPGATAQLIFDVSGSQPEATRPLYQDGGLISKAPGVLGLGSWRLESLDLASYLLLSYRPVPAQASTWEKRVTGVSLRSKQETGWDRKPLFPRGGRSTPWILVDEESEALRFTFLEPPDEMSLSALQVDIPAPSRPDSPKPMALLTLLPLPWQSTSEESRGKPRPIRHILQPEPGAPGGVHPETLIPDPEMGMVLAYLESGDVGSALAYQHFLFELAEYARLGLMWNPFAAAAGAYAMLCLGTQRLAWTERLWRLCSWVPDSGIVHASLLLRHFRPGSEELTVIRDALVGAAWQGPPVFSGGVRRLVDGLAQVASTRQFREDPEVRLALGYARALAGMALPGHQCTTLFAPREHLDDLLGGAAAFEHSPLNPGDPP